MPDVKKIVAWSFWRACVGMSSGTCSRGRRLATHLWLEIQLRELSDLVLPESFIERHDAVLTLLGPYREDSLAPFLAQLGSARAEQSLPFLVDDDDFRFGDGDAVEERGGREPGVHGDGDSPEEVARPPAAEAPKVRSGDGSTVMLKLALTR